VTGRDDRPDLNIDPVVERTESEGPADPNLDPERSPGAGRNIDGLEDIEVSRDDIEMGEADPADLTAADTGPVADDSIESLVSDLQNGAPRDRQRAAIALAKRQPDEGTLEALASSARSDPDADVRQFAVEALASLDEPAGADVALDALSDDDPWVRAEAIVTLDDVDREAFIEDIERALDDDHPAVRRNALVSLWKVHGVEMLDRLLPFARDESDRVREWVATLLGGIDDPRAKNALMELTKDPHDIVATTAADALESAAEDVSLDTGATAPHNPEQSSHDTPPDL
jgi:hypothetical protein